MSDEEIVATIVALSAAWHDAVDHKRRAVAVLDENLARLRRTISDLKDLHARNRGRVEQIVGKNTRKPRQGLFVRAKNTRGK
jgi:hypothetical protein